MRVINGFTVIAHRETGGDFVLLAVREANFTKSGFEYVTAQTSDLANAHWYLGHYYGDLDAAVSDFKHRS